MMIPQSLQQAAEAFAQHANTYAPLFSAPTSTLGPVGRTSATPQAVSPYAKSVTGPNIPTSTQPTVDAVSGAQPMVSAPLSATPVTQKAPMSKTDNARTVGGGSSILPGSDMSDYMRHGLSAPDTSQVSAPATAPGGLDMQTIIGGLLSLVEGGLRTASGYHQGLSGDQGPTAWDKTLERQQALKLQQNQLAQQVAIQSAQFKFDTDMKKLDRQLQLDLQSAGNDFAKQQITAQGDVNRNLLWQGLEKQIQLIQRVYGGRDITQTGGQSPTINDISQMLAVTK